MLKKLAIALGLLVGSAGLAYATGETVASWFKQSNMNPVLVQGSDGTDAQPLRVSTTGSLFVAGGAADDAAASGNPVPIGCKHNTTANTVEDGDISYLNCGTRGSLYTSIRGPDSVNGAGVFPTGDGIAAAGAHLFTGSFGQVYNGSTFDREFICPSTAVVNVAAAATTQIIALSGSTVIRVCDGIISADTAATTATIVYGTGANCATGQAAITGAMRLQDEGNIQLTPFRGLAANAICITAATGAVTGYLRYAQY